MKRYRACSRRALLHLTFGCVAVVCARAGAGGFYTRPALFSTRPDDQSNYVQSIDRFGPVGIGIELHPPAFVMKVKNVEDGSPAAATGLLEAGQIIATINGQTLKDIDPRIQLGNIITEAEATDGLIRLMIKDAEDTPPREVIVTLPVLGAYSATWPVDCAKSDRIVRELADNLAATDWSGRIDLYGSKMLFLLSTGEEKDLEVVRRWVRKSIDANRNFGDSGLAYQWFVSWGAPPLAEYYLRTGDEEVLPVLQRVADAVRKTMYHDGWGGRGLANHHMGHAGTGTLTFLLLARQCGVEVEETMLQRALIHYFRFAGRGINPYMDDRPEAGFTDNGRNARLAFAMSAASALVPGGERSLYASARDISAFRSFHSSSYMLHGHTGGGIGEVWRSAAMGLLIDKKPGHYREFMDKRTWWYDLSRRHDGSFGVLGGGSYDANHVGWVGPSMGLTYTAPRRKLSIFGAPRSPYAKHHNLPDRPWGTAADDAFYSLEAAEDEQGEVADLSGETVAAHTALPLHRRIDQGPVSDAFILAHVRHPEQGIRQAAAGALERYGRHQLLPRLLRDRDARVRQAGLMAIGLPHRRGTGILEPGIAQEHFTPEIRSILWAMIHDPAESWFVVDRALAALAMAPAEEIAPHLERLAHWLNHDEWWLRESALKPLIVLAADGRHTQRVMPVLEEALPDTIRAGTIRPLVAYADPLRTADPAVQMAVRDMLGSVYLRYPGRNANPPGGLHPVISERTMLSALAGAMAALPGGKETLFEVSRQRMPGRSLPHQDVFLSDVGRGVYGEEMEATLRRVIVDELIPVHIGRNWTQLQAFVTATGEGGARAMRELQELHARTGNSDFGWEVHGPKRNRMEWHYVSFDPPEKWTEPDDRLGRFRDVTFPEGLDNWFSPRFDPVRANWKKGLAPFGAADGEKRHPAITQTAPGCGQSFCGCLEPINTLWEREVLLLNGTFTFPRLEEGYAYRLLHGGISHVGSGGGYRVYVNGRLFIEDTRGVDRRDGGVAVGREIPRDWWDEFNGGPVRLSVISFKKRHPRTRAYGGNIAISMERMRCPPLPLDALHKSAEFIPMFSSEWQSLQDPGRTQMDPDEGKFRYDGGFVANAGLPGAWRALGRVGRIEAFVPGDAASPDGGRPGMSQVTFFENGRTDNPMWIWSGDTLMDLENFHALKTDIRRIGDTEYLFVEAGGFSNRHHAGWTTPWVVFRRQQGGVP